MKSLSIIVPCYNEALGIKNLYTRLSPILEKLQEEYELEVLFIDDGSKDNTLDLLKEHFGRQSYTRILKHEVNMNLGAAMRTGFSRANGDIVVTMDSDCTYDPQEIFKMLEMMDDDTSIVTASPYHKDGKVENVPEYRLFLSRGISFIYRKLTKSDIKTFTALFRAQRKDVVKSVMFESNNFLATAEMLIYALMKGHKVKEFPTTLHVREYGVSKMRLLGVIKSHLKFIGKFSKIKILSWGKRA